MFSVAEGIDGQVAQKHLMSSFYFGKAEWPAIDNVNYSDSMRSGAPLYTL